ncbi:MAG: DUF4364 family protein [Clostridia bacterium]|jgi:hypothetical protein|nr:putative uncharacterized protein [Clostridium sp. CAG:571]HJJ06900.1 DUF4364 family protein [Clostridiaceae bacterium]HJJ13590.1 DUF4364 family protein [Clostridiaceae bacterium]
MDILPGIIKLKADTNLKKELEHTEEEYSIVAEYTPRSENNYIVFCKIVENSETVFEVKTFAGSREQAKEIVDNWKSNAESIYPEILKSLTTKKNK